MPLVMYQVFCLFCFVMKFTRRKYKMKSSHCLQYVKNNFLQPASYGFVLISIKSFMNPISLSIQVVERYQSTVHSSASKRKHSAFAQVLIIFDRSSSAMPFDYLFTSFHLVWRRDKNQTMMKLMHSDEQRAVQNC